MNALGLGPKERWPVLLRERFALLERLTREGRCAEIMAAGDGPRAWERLQALADRTPLPPREPRQRRGKGGRPRGSRGPGWQPMVDAILGELGRRGPMRLTPLSDYVGKATGQVYQALQVLANQGLVERRSFLWALRA